MQHTLDFKPASPPPNTTSRHCDAHTVFSSTRLPAPPFLALKGIHTQCIPWRPRSPIVLDRTRSFIQITVFVHVRGCVPIPGFIDKATCFIFTPFFLLLTSWLTRRGQVVTPLYTTFRVSSCMQGSLSRIPVFVPLLVTFLRHSPCPPNPLSPCHRTESSSSVSLPHVRLM
jgi:hypothetical protein